MVQQKLPGQSDSTKFTFTVPINSAKKAEVNKFHPHAPGIKYLQNDENYYYFSSLESDLFSYGEYVL